MATTGWLGEQTVHQWGGWGTRFTTNVYISGIRRYSDHVDVSGTIYLYCKSNGAYSVWYDWNITSWSMGNNLGQIKERTYTNNILNRSWGKNFTVRINCSNSATSATFNAGFSDSNIGGRDKYWTIYFDRYATAPSGIKSTSSYTEYSTITTSCSGINWGQGYSNRTLTCTASYTFNGKTENFTLGTWNDGATSKTVTKNDFNFPADLNVSIKWVASTNVGSTTSSSQVRVGQTYPAPNLSGVNFEGSSPSTYKLNVTVTGINYGENYSKREANLYFDYTLDGISYSTLLSSISDGSSSMTVEYDATTESEPWKFIPDDEKGVLRLVVDNGHQTSTKSSAQIYCQPQYEAYIVESIPDSEKEKSEIYTGKNIQIQNAPKDAPLADFKLHGNTFQQSYTGQNLYNIAQVSSGTYVTKDDDGWITITRDNTSGSSAVYTNVWTSNLALETSTRYKIFIEVKAVSGTGSLFITSTNSTEGQFSSWQEKTLAGMKAGKTYTVNPTTKSSFSGISKGLRTVLQQNAGQGGSVTFRLSVCASSTPEETFSYEPFVCGTPSPNPDYPQQIQVVTGLQTVEIQGKNLANPTPVPGGSNGVVATYNSQTGVVTVSGTVKTTWSNPFKVSNSIYLPAGTYTLKQYGELTNGRITCYTQGYGYQVNASTLQKTFTTTRDGNAYICITGLTAGNSVSGSIKFQLEAGSTATSFVPYSEQTYEINLGKNLFNQNDVVNGIPANTDGSIVSTTSVGRTSDFITVIPNTSYSHTGHPKGWAVIAWYRADKSFIKRNSDATTVTSPNEAFYARVSCAQGDLGTCQFEAGEPTSYAPYFEPIELCKLGTYQDYIWKDGEDWKVHKVTDSITLDEMDWTNETAGDGYGRRYRSKTLVGQIYQIGSNNDIANMVCSNYTVGNMTSTWSSGGQTIALHTNKSVYIYDSRFKDEQTTTALDSWLSSEKPSLYYPLATPTDTVITDQTLIEQLEAIRKASLQNGVNNITNIAIVPNLAGDMEIRYYTKWQDTFPATLYSNGKNGTGQFKQIRRIGTK